MTFVAHLGFYVGEANSKPFSQDSQVILYAARAHGRRSAQRMLR